VNAVAPGYIATDLNQRLRDDPVRYQEMLDRIPAGRWGTPDDLAATFVYLCSPASAYMTGQVVTVDGGWMSR
jgi:2-deoxy-D-gluconate 3-dehydrogenase